jgi:hypothetical protein
VADIDRFASSLLEEAKRFLEKASTEGDPAGQVAYLHAALNLAFCSLEAHINAVAEELAAHKEFSSPHDQGVFLEKEVRLEDGEFKLKALRIYHLDDRILFLHKRVTGKLIDKAATWWSELAVAMKLRNKLTHPKEAPGISRNLWQRFTSGWSRSAIEDDFLEEDKGRHPQQLDRMVRLSERHWHLASGWHPRRWFVTPALAEVHTHSSVPFRRLCNPLADRLLIGLNATHRVGLKS